MSERLVSKPHSRLWFSPHGTEWEAESYEEALEMERDSLVEQLEAAPKLSFCAYCGVGFEWDGQGDSCPGCKRANDLQEQLEAVAEIRRVSEDYRYSDEFVGSLVRQQFKRVWPGSIPASKSDD